MNASYSSEQLDHLGLVAGMFDKLKLEERINELVPQDFDQVNLSVGTCVKAFILIGLGFSERRLYLASHFFENAPIKHLLGANVTPDMLNDDRLGRCLDAIYKFGASQLFLELSKNILEIMNLKSSNYYHLDSTSFHVDGEYINVSNGKAIEVNHGHSRDYRPDLKQVIMNLLVENKFGIPIMMEALSGNTNDKVNFKNFLVQFSKSLTFDDENPPTWVADSALYSANTLSVLNDHDWITRVPSNIKECKDIINSCKSEELKPFHDDKLSGYRYKFYDSNYGEIKQSWLLVESEAGKHRERKTVVKRALKKSGQENKDFEKIKREKFKCKADAEKALEKFKKKLKYGEIEELEIKAIEGYSKGGRPSKGSKKEVVAYFISGIYCCNIDKFRNFEKGLGRFVLATNKELSAKELLSNYKNQSKVERGFRFLKDKQFMASTIFLKKPERIEALLMVMSLCLSVYACLEKELR